MKAIIILVLSSVFFLSCTQQKKDTISLLNTGNIDSLITTAQNKKFTFKKRLFDANLAYEYVANNDAIENKDYIDLAQVFYELGNKEKYLHLLRKLYRKSIIKKDHEGISESAYGIANTFYSKAQYDSAYFYFAKSEKSYVQIKDKSVLASFIKNIRADILTFKKDYVGAEKLAVEALKVAKEENFDLLTYNCYITLGNSLGGLKDYDKAIEYYRKAIEASDKLKADPQYLNLRVMPYNYIANAYLKKTDYDNAIKMVRQALRFDDFKKNNPTIYCYLVNTLAYSRFKRGDKTTLSRFQETLKIGDSLKSIPIQITSKTYLGEYYLVKNDTLKANLYLKDAQVESHKNHIFEDELKILTLLALSNPDDKSLYANRYISLNDSLQVVERATRDKFARIEFETDEITTERNSLSLKTENLSLQRWIIIGISIASIIIIILWFMNKSQKAKTRELLLKQEQQKANEDIYQLMLDQQQKIQEGKNIEKQRISLELHDGVMGKLSAVRLNLYASLYKANLIEDASFSTQIDEIQAVEEEIRNIAHDLNSNLFSDNSNFIEIVKELFAKTENHSQIHFILEVSDAVNWDLVNNTIKINLYRILQEALHNIEKYANAKNVSITMTQTDLTEIKVSITDDGNGFDLKQKQNGIGIKNMKLRMLELGGTFDIESGIKNGTKIDLIIPF
ncbi:MAG TPA: tetratricopeptide repeat protein [Flavobacterium sp.]